MKLKALRALRYAGKSVLKGEVFESKNSDVRVLVGARIAAHYVEPPAPKPVPAVFKPIPPFVPSEAEVELVKSEETKKRGYRRRDMTAEE